MLRNFELDRLLEQYWDLYGPLVRTLGASGLAGMATAATLKVGCWKEGGKEAWSSGMRAVLAHDACSC
jgi:hypothetical protein